MLKVLLLVLMLVNIAFTLKCQSCQSLVSMDDCVAQQTPVNCPVGKDNCFEYSSGSLYRKGCSTESDCSRSMLCYDRECEGNCCYENYCNSSSTIDAKIWIIVVMLCSAAMKLLIF